MSSFLVDAEVGGCGDVRGLLLGHCPGPIAAVLVTAPGGVLAAVVTGQEGCRGPGSALFSGLGRASGWDLSGFAGPCLSCGPVGGPGRC